MRTLMKLFLPALAAVILVGFGHNRAADKPKYTIEEIMEKAHGEEGKMEGFVFKIIEGKGTKEQKQMLVEMYKALAENKPPKGDAKSWKDKTAAMIAAAEAVAKDEKDSLAKLKKTLDCDACHKVHRD